MKTITIYELMGLINDRKEPKNIKYNFHKWIWDSNYDEYFSNTDSSYALFQNELNGILPKSLNDTVEILPEENDEWEDIEEYDLKPDDWSTPTQADMEIQKRLNVVIKNQKYLKKGWRVKMNKPKLKEFLENYLIAYKFCDKEKYLFASKDGVSRKIPYWEFEYANVDFKTIICQYLLNIEKLEDK